MKSQVLRKRFWTWQAAANATTIDLEPGFGTPKACLIYFTESSANLDTFDTTLASRTLGIGMIGSTDTGVSSALRVISVHASITDNADPTTVRRNHLPNRFIRAQNVAGTTFWDMATVAFLTDSIRITPTASTPQTNGHLDCIFVVLGGDDVRSGIGTFVFSGTAGGTSQLTSLGFQPDLIFVASPITANTASGTDDFRFCWGAATRSPLKQKGVYLHCEGANFVDMGALSSSNTMIYYSTSNGVGPYTHTISGITTGGWTFTSSDAAGGSNNIYNFLAIRTNNPADFALVDILTPTTNQIQFTGLGISGFVPKTLVGAAVNAPTDNTRATTSPGADSIQLFGGNRSPDSKFFMGPGTIQTNSGGTAVTGTGTAFSRLGPGDKIYTLQNSLLGTVSGVTSEIAMTLAANATASFASTGYVFSTPGQFCISYGAEDDSDPSAVFSRMSSDLVDMARSSAGTPVTLECGELTDFDTSNGFNLNFTTTSGTARRGWMVAIKGNEAFDKNRRRIP